MTNRLIGKCELESFQIYFTASLEIQRELIEAGYRVPTRTPIPIVYGDYKGYETGRPGGGVSKAAILNPSRYGRSTEEMGWVLLENNKYSLPDEKADVRFYQTGDAGDESIMMTFSFPDGMPGYHLEKASYAGTGPRKWNNWSMFYLGIEELEDLTAELFSSTVLDKSMCSIPLSVMREKLPKGGGSEDTYFACLNDEGSGVDPRDWSLCMGCYEPILEYLKLDKEMYGLQGLETPNDKNLKLRLSYSGEVPSVLKMGIAKVEDKDPQFMIKISSPPQYRPIEIDGIDDDGNPIAVVGKARGKLEPCDHSAYDDRVVIKKDDFLRVVCAFRNFYYGETSPLKDRDCSKCFTCRARRAEWLPGREGTAQRVLVDF